MNFPVHSGLRLPASMRVFERGWLSSNNILFISDKQTALVDSGYLTHAPQTLALVAHALQGRALDLLVNTHLHSDHCGGNAALPRCQNGCRSDRFGKLGGVDWSKNWHDTDKNSKTER